MTFTVVSYYGDGGRPKLHFRNNVEDVINIVADEKGLGANVSVYRNNADGSYLITGTELRGTGDEQ